MNYIEQQTLTREQFDQSCKQFATMMLKRLQKDMSETFGNRMDKECDLAAVKNLINTYVEFLDKGTS